MTNIELSTSKKIVSMLINACGGVGCSLIEVSTQDLPVYFFMKRNLQKFCMLFRYGVLTNMVVKNFIFTLKWQTLSFLGADKLTIATRLLENNLSTMQISSVSPKKKRKTSTIIKIHKYFITRRAIYLKENRVAILHLTASEATGQVL